MKKVIIFVVCFLILLVFPSCINITPLSGIDGVFESEDGKIRIDFSNDDPTKFGYDGELVNDDGTIERIVFKGLNGQFRIYKFRGESGYGPDDSLLKGKLKKRKDTLILLPDDGEEIILKKVPEVCQSGNG